MSRGKPLEGAVSTNGSNNGSGSPATNGSNGRAWRLWAVGAAIPLSFVGFVLYWVHQRSRVAAATLDPYEEWWQARRRTRENGANGNNGANNDRGVNGTRPETPRARPEGNNPLFV
jgi:hypothetical protein